MPATKITGQKQNFIPKGIAKTAAASIPKMKSRYLSALRLINQLIILFIIRIFLECICESSEDSDPSIHIIMEWRIDNRRASTYAKTPLLAIVNHFSLFVQFPFIKLWLIPAYPEAKATIEALVVFLSYRDIDCILNYDWNGIFNS